jgi:hypothetical protein
MPTKLKKYHYVKKINNLPFNSFVSLLSVVTSDTQNNSNRKKTTHDRYPNNRYTTWYLTVFNFKSLRITCVCIGVLSTHAYHTTHSYSHVIEGIEGTKYIERLYEVRRIANIKSGAVKFKIVPNILKYSCFVQLRKKNRRFVDFTV